VTNPTTAPTEYSIAAGFLSIKTYFFISVANDVFVFKNSFIVILSATK